MKTKRIRRSAAQWQEISRHYTVSNLGVEAFCEAQDISVSSLYYWRKKLAPTTGQVEIEAASADGFIELGEARQRNHLGRFDIELELGGMMLRIKQG